VAPQAGGFAGFVVAGSLTRLFDGRARPSPPMTLGNIREQGARHLIASL
jgi:hypothetical protein